MSLSKLKRIKFNERGIECAKLDGHKIIALKNTKISEYEILIPNDCIFEYKYSKNNILKRIFSGKSSKYCIKITNTKNMYNQINDAREICDYKSSDKAKELFKLIAASSFLIEIYLDRDFHLINVYYEYYSSYPKNFWESSIHLFDREYPCLDFIASKKYD